MVVFAYMPFPRLMLIMSFDRVLNLENTVHYL